MKKKSGYFYLLLSLAGLIIVMMLTNSITSSGYYAWGYALIRAVICLATCWFFWRGVLVLLQDTASRNAKNILVVVGSIFTVLLLLEIAFSFAAVSSGGTETLISRNWFARYWRTNSLGYRDYDPQTIDRPEKQNILIVGDSYVAGHGLSDTAHRFSNILAHRFAPGYDIFNLAVRGADTRDEMSFLRTFPVKPDILIVAHTNNDIYTVVDKAEIATLLPVPKDIARPMKLKSSKCYVINHLFFPNFLHYLITEWMRKIYITERASSFISFSQFLYSDDARLIEMCYYRSDTLLQLHFRNIDHIVDYAHDRQIPLYVLLFPKMNDEVVEFTNATANIPLNNYLKLKGVSCINLTPILLNLSQSHRMVSRFDPHPSAKSNALIADTLTGLLRRMHHTTK